MKKLFHILALSLMFTVLSAQPSHAQIKSALEFITGIVKGVQDVVGQVQDKVNNVITQTRQKITERKDQFMDKKEYKSLMKKAQKAEKIGNSDEAKDLKEAAEEGKKANELNKKKKKIEEEIAEQKQDALTDRDGKIRLVDANLSNQKQIINNSSISEDEKKAQLKAAEDNAASEKDALNSEYNQIIDDLEKARKAETGSIDDEMKQIAINQAERERKKIESKKSDKAKEATTVEGLAGDSFLPEGAIKDAQNTQQIRDDRNKKAMQTIKEGFAKILEIKKAVSENNQVAADQTNLMEDQATMIDKQQIYIDMTVDNIRALSEYLRLVITEIKITAATELAKSTSYNTKRKEDDMSQLNLCDYTYVPK